MATGGRFQKGQSGNPSGRAHLFREYLRGLIGEHGEGAYDIAWEIAQGKRTAKHWLSGGKDCGPVEVDAKPSIREQLDASVFLIERLQGKSVQPMEHGLADVADEQLEARYQALIAEGLASMTAPPKQGLASMTAPPKPEGETK